MTSEEIRCLIKELGDIRHVLSGADPVDKADVYRHLNLQMTYHPAKRTVRVETSLDPHGWGYGACPEGVSTSTPTSCNTENCWSSVDCGGMTMLVCFAVGFRPGGACQPGKRSAVVGVDFT
ncbi:hypothetical protein [Nocardia sp. NPDC049526]|uniref:hypothetical protein n=1 Tax=Nocardia sp. NPDC049526 TaxID=3364316 RepID=UPI003788252E